MNKVSLFAIILIILGISAYFYFQHLKKTVTFESKTVEIAKRKFKIEIAKTPTQLAVGLGNRRSLCEKCGMVFVFNYDGVLPFWMKDTLIPLDMIWIDKNFEIVSIQSASVEPDVTNPLKIYSNSAEARYVIELNQGMANELGLRLGNKIDLSKINE